MDVLTEKITMKLSRIAVLLAATVAGALLVAAHLDAQTGAAGSSGPVAVCNVTEIFSNCQKRKDVTADLKKERAMVEGEGKKRAEKIKNLQKELRGLTPESEAYNRSFAEIQRLKFNLSAWSKFEADKGMRKHGRLTKEIYSDIQKAIAFVAKRRGFKVVVHHQRGALQATRSDDMLTEISLRTVVYSDQTVDITVSVLSALNEAYRRQK